MDTRHPRRPSQAPSHFENLEDRRLMSLTAAPAYLVPTAPGVEINSPTRSSRGASSC